MAVMAPPLGTAVADPITPRVEHLLAPVDTMPIEFAPTTAQYCQCIRREMAYLFGDLDGNTWFRTMAPQTRLIADRARAGPSLGIVMGIVDSMVRIIGFVPWYAEGPGSSFTMVPYGEATQFPPTAHSDLPRDFPTVRSFEPFNVRF